MEVIDRADLTAYFKLKVLEVLTEMIETTCQKNKQADAQGWPMRFNDLHDQTFIIKIGNDPIIKACINNKCVLSLFYYVSNKALSFENHELPANRNRK